MTATDSAEVSFPRLSARTQRFTLGVPHAFSVRGEGRRAFFLRSHTGDDPVGCLWLYQVDAATERLLADPREVLAGADEALTDAERSRRERLREGGRGVVGYAADRAGDHVVFALSGRLFLVEVGAGTVRELPARAPVVDPRLDPTGARVAYVSSGTLRVIDCDGGTDRALATDDDPAVTWGLAEFIAAEEMDRHRGYWWSPDGARVLAARVDENPVHEWQIHDPGRPDQHGRTVRYPAAGTPNADVRVAMLSAVGEPAPIQVEWDRAAFPYLVSAGWDEHGPLLSVQSRDQTRLVVLAVDPSSGTTSALAEHHDPHWVEVIVGTPTRLPDGRLVTTVDDGGSGADTPGVRRLAVEGEPVSPPDLNVLAVIDAGPTDVLVVATTEPTERHLWLIRPDGRAVPVTTTSGVHHGARGDGVIVVSSASMDHDGTQVTVLSGDRVVGPVESAAISPPFAPSATFLSSGTRSLRTVVLLPAGHRRGSPLPVLLDPYAGPGAARVLRARSALLTSQWFADQGFAVVVADGRGTPARGPGWERAIADDLAETVLADQIDALHAVAESMPDLDLSRVGIRGWSFGGYVAALAVLRRPDAVHAAVAGAPVTDWSLYDTHYTERYLGLPQDNPGRYAAASLIDDAPKLRRPLLIVHGLADDNVFAAHTIRLSSALLAAGRTHSVLPLSGVTHMTPQEVVAENLLVLQVEFLKHALGVTEP